MEIKTALILCAGYGKRLNPVTLSKPKPLIEINQITLLQNTLNLINSLGIKNILINSFYLSEQIENYVASLNLNLNLKVIKDGNKILDTGGGILNLLDNSNQNDFLIFNPDTLWNENYLNDINKMQDFYFSNKLNNILLLTNKELSFDKNLKGDFELNNNLLQRGNNKNFIFIGCQILNKNLFKKYNVKNFPISEIWNELLKKKELNGFESLNKFYHLTDIKIFKKLKDF